MKKILAVMALLALAGCASVPASKDVGATAHVKCERSEQRGCIEIDVLNARWDSKNPLMRGLDKPYGSPAERYRRVTELGPTLYKGYNAGVVESARGRTFVVFLWNVDKAVPDGHLAAYRLNGRGADRKLEKVGFDDARWSSTPPVFDPVSKLGKPDRVYRVTAKGNSPIGAALQIPWSMVTAGTYILVCSEDRETVYPNRQTADDGLWITPEYLNAAKERGWRYMVLPFLSQK